MRFEPNLHTVVQLFRNLQQIQGLYFTLCIVVTLPNTQYSHSKSLQKSTRNPCFGKRGTDGRTDGRTHPLIEMQERI